MISLHILKMLWITSIDNFMDFFMQNINVISLIYRIYFGSIWASTKISQIFKQQIIQGTFLYGFMQPAAGKGRGKWGICLGDAFWERQNWARKISEFAWVFEESDILIGVAFYSLPHMLQNLCPPPYATYVWIFKFFHSISTFFVQGCFYSD